MQLAQQGLVLSYLFLPLDFIFTELCIGLFGHLFLSVERVWLVKMVMAGLFKLCQSVYALHQHSEAEDAKRVGSCFRGRRIF